MAGIAGTLEHELDPVGAKPRSDPRERFDSALGAALASGLAAVSDLPSAAAFSDSGFRGPFPSLP